MQGTVDPDEFYVHKPTFRQGFRSVLRRTLGDKQVRMVYAPGRTREPVVNKPTPKADRARYCLSDADVLELADAAIKIEDHYSRQAGEFRPMDIEWAKDGPDGALYIVQARPETAASRISTTQLEEYVLDGSGTVQGQGPRGRRARGRRQGTPRHRRAPAARVQAGRGAGGRTPPRPTGNRS